MESIQIIIDVACHIVSKNNLGTPKSYAECIELLTKFNYVDEALGNKLKKMTGLRNILIHDYFVVDVKRLYDLPNNLDDMTAFVNAVRAYV